MALEDFERELLEDQARRNHRKRSRGRSRSPRNRSKHHREDKHERSHDDHKKSRKSRDSHHSEIKSGRRTDERKKVDKPVDEEEDEWVEKEPIAQFPGEDTLDNRIAATTSADVKRDSWMEKPSSLEIDYVQRKRKRTPPPQHIKATEADFKLKMHENELNHQLRDISDDDSSGRRRDKQEVSREISYKFGDSGSSWRMTKLRAVYRKAEETGRRIEDIAVDRYGSLREFDEAREEELELDRRKTYGHDYAAKEKPSGELYQQRNLDGGIQEQKRLDVESEDEFEAAQGEIMQEKPVPATTVPLDQTALNKLKAQMLKAKLKGGSEAVKLEAEYNQAMAAAANRKQSDVVVLNKMESRMLAGGRKGEVNSIDNKRGRERGHVAENEDMSIDDMVRQERRTKGQMGGDSRSFAERIAKDAKFDNDLDYMDENANKLSKSVQKSDINLRNTAVADYQKMKRILDNCPLCHNEDTSTPPHAPIVSLATRVYLTLPTSPEITPYGLCASIVPIQHRLNLLECDEDEWEEVRNFMKSLTRYYYSQKPSLSVIFYENAAHEGRKRHASMEAVPLPVNHAETAPAFFREAILAADEEWTQHRKVIDTMQKATSGGLGKHAFRKTMVSELPYFHAWFTLDGGLGHVVEDPRRWPKGDLFAREILGGMLDVGPDVINKQGRWKRGDREMEQRVQNFRRGWEKWDWTTVLMEAA